MTDTESNISKYIRSKPRGTLLFPDDFSHLGTPAAIRKALQRLREKGLIKSVTYGIYVRPKISELIGEVLPSAEEVALGIAKRDKIKIVPTGSHALHALGLSTQVPLNLVFLTDGAARTIKVGKRTIKFKRTTPKNLLAKGKISAMVIQALREIGKDKATTSEINKIVALLKQDDTKHLDHDISLAPAWIKEIMKRAIEKMSSINFYKLKKEEKNIIFEAIGNTTGIPASAVEKDWWVVLTLALIQKLEVAEHIVFKGGTSLSKAWNVIERFSEDIDLALDKQFLGIGECTTVRQVKKLRSATRKYIYNTFIPELKNKFANAGYSDAKVELYEEDGENLEPVQIIVIYDTCTPLSSYTKPEVKIEIGSRSLREPFTNRVFSSLVGEHYHDRPFSDAPITFPSVNPERTLLEKLFLLHEEFQKPVKEIRVNRLSRHLYDVEKLMHTEFIDLALDNQSLYNEIINHRSMYTKIAAVDYSLHQPKTLNPIPPDKILEDWKKDYKSMQEAMIYGESLPFEQLIKRINELKQRINSLNWS